MLEHKHPICGKGTTAIEKAKKKKDSYQLLCGVSWWDFAAHCRRRQASMLRIIFFNAAIVVSRGHRLLRF